MVTRDGQEYLIPNEDLLSCQVINCSYSSREVRLKVPIRIAYNSDVNLAVTLAEEAVREVPRILHQPPPACHLVGLGESGISLSLYFWINDPEQGTASPTSAVLKRVLDRYADHGVRIPFPQQEVRIKELPQEPAEA